MNKKALVLLTFFLIALFTFGSFHLNTPGKDMEDENKKYGVYKVKKESFNKYKLKDKLLGEKAKVFPSDKNNMVTYANESEYVDLYDDGVFVYTRKMKMNLFEKPIKETTKEVESFVQEYADSEKKIKLKDINGIKVVKRENKILSYEFVYYQYLDNFLVEGREAVAVYYDSEGVVYYKRDVLDIDEKIKEIKIKDEKEVKKEVYKNTTGQVSNHVVIVYLVDEAEQIMYPVYKFQTSKERAIYINAETGEFISAISKKDEENSF